MTAAITLNPTTSLPGASVGVAGTGFGNRRTCTIKVDSISIKSVRSGKAGRFNTSVIAPSQNGVHNVSASSTAGSATAVLTVQAPTPPPPIDPPPVISNIVISAITQTSANVAWDVSEDAQGWIEYGETTSYGSETNHETSFNYSHHSQTINGLAAEKVYHCRIVVVDLVGQIAKSADISFKTLSFTVTPSPTRPFSGPITTSTISVPSTITTGSAFNAWILGKSGALVEFPAGASYDLDVGFKFESLHTMILNLNGAILRVKGAGNTPNSSPFVLRACNNIAINGPATVIGNNPNTTNIFVSGNENSHVLALSGWYGLAPSSYIEITGITASNIYGDFAYLEGNNIDGNRAPSHHVWVHENKGTYIGRNAISLINVTDVWEGQNNFDKIGMDIIDIEPNFGPEQIRRIISSGDTIGSYGHMTQFAGFLVNSWGVDASSVVEDITIQDHVVAGNPSGGYAGSGIRALHVQFTDHVDTRRVTIQRLSTTRAAPGPTMRFTSVDGVTCRANNQPLLSGSLAQFNNCTNVVTN